MNIVKIAMDDVLSILARGSPNSANMERTVVIFDDASAECLKLCGVRLNIDVLLLNLDSCLGEKGLELEMFQPDLMVFLLCTPLKEAAPLISHSVRLANCGRVVVLTTSSMDEVESQSSNSMEGDPYAFIKRELHPSKVTVSYFPLHGVFLPPISKQQQQQHLDTFILSSADARSFAALSLNRLGLWSPVLNTEEGTRLLDSDTGRDLQVAIEEVEVQQISASVRGQMRSLAHQLAGALVFNIGVDVAASMFACGKSSDAISNTLQPLLDPLVEQYNDALDAYSAMINPAMAMDHRPSMSGSLGGDLQAQLRATAIQWAQGGVETGNGPTRLQPASLLMIDRWQDLFSPAMARSPHNPFGVLNAARSPDTKTKSCTGSPPLWEDIFSEAESKYKAEFNISASVLAAREQALMQLLALPNVGLGECLPYLLSFLEEGNARTDTDNNRQADPCRGPGCFLSTLLLVAVTLHLVGLGDDDEGGGGGGGSLLSETLPLLTNALVDYLLHRAPQRELAVLAAHGLLGPHDLVVESLIASRKGETEGALLSEGMLTLELQQKMEQLSGALAELAYHTAYQSNGAFENVGEEEAEEEGGGGKYVHAEACIRHLQAERGQGGKRSNKADMVTIRAVSSREHRGYKEGVSEGEGEEGVAVPSLLAALLREVLVRRDVQASPSSPLATLDFIESPMAKLKRAGLGLLSQGLGAFGWGGGSNHPQGASSNPRIGIEAPHPGDSPVIVIFMVGGIVASEVDELRAVLAEYRQQQPRGPRIVLGSNRALTAPELALDLFHC